MKPLIFIREPQTPKEFVAYYLVRYEVLRKPWNKTEGSEKDEIENDCVHAMACDENNNVMGVCRLQFNTETEAQLRYMAVVKNAQGTGVGKALIDFMEWKAIEKGSEKIILQSRENAVGFYKKCGYTIVEKSFLMWGEIQHYLMEKKL